MRRLRRLLEHLLECSLVRSLERSLERSLVRSLKRSLKRSLGRVSCVFSGVGLFSVSLDWEIESAAVVWRSSQRSPWSERL
jgi:hypothetical protein